MRLLWAVASAVLLFGCATGGTPELGAPLGPDPGMVGLLDKLASNPILDMAMADASATLAWVDTQVKADPPMEPLKAELARACPKAVLAASADLKAKIEALKATMTGPTDEVKAPHVILSLTKLKYGDADPRGKVDRLKKDIALRIDVLYTGCSHLFPTAQALELAKILGKAGVITAVPALAVVP